MSDTTSNSSNPASPSNDGNPTDGNSTNEKKDQRPESAATDGLNIYRRKDGRWEGRYLKDPPTTKKTTKYGYVYGDSYEAVAAKLDRYINVESFRNVFEEWLVFKKPQVKISTFSRYRNVGNAYLLPRFWREEN